MRDYDRKANGERYMLGRRSVWPPIVYRLGVIPLVNPYRWGSSEGSNDPTGIRCLNSRLPTIPEVDKVYKTQRHGWLYQLAPLRDTLTRRAKGMSQVVMPFPR